LTRQDVTRKFRRRGAQELFKGKRRVVSHTVCQKPFAIRERQISKLNFRYAKRACISKACLVKELLFDAAKILQIGRANLCQHETPNG
jgi:hypothetical protein